MSFLAPITTSTKIFCKIHTQQVLEGLFLEDWIGMVSYYEKLGDRRTVELQYKFGVCRIQNGIKLKEDKFNLAKSICLNA